MSGTTVQRGKGKAAYGIPSTSYSTLLTYIMCTYKRLYTVRLHGEVTALPSIGLLLQRFYGLRAATVDPHSSGICLSRRTV